MRDVVAQIGDVVAQMRDVVAQMRDVVAQMRDVVAQMRDVVAQMGVWWRRLGMRWLHCRALDCECRRNPRLSKKSFSSTPKQHFISVDFSPLVSHLPSFSHPISYGGHLFPPSEEALCD
jgi:hypothetical protein